MIQFIRLLFISFSLFCFGFSFTMLLEAWEYQYSDPNISLLLKNNITSQQINQKIGDAINDGRLDDANVYLGIAKDHGYLIDYAYYERYIQQKDTPQYRLQKQIIDFKDGFLYGSSAESAGIVGAITADLTVVGDIRDLYAQYNNYANDRAVDQLVVGLAGVGVGLTLATYGSAGSIAPVKTGTSVLKIAKKARYLNPRFSSELIKRVNNVFNWKQFSKLLKQKNKINDVTQSVRLSFNYQALAPLKHIAQQINKIREYTSIQDVLLILKYVDNSNDLRRIEKLSRRYKGQARGLLALLGKASFRSVRVLRKTGRLILSFFGTIMSIIFTLLFLFSGSTKTKKPSN